MSEPNLALTVAAETFLEIASKPLKVAALFAHRKGEHPLATVTLAPSPDGGVQLLASDGARLLDLRVPGGVASRRVVLPARPLLDLIAAHKDGDRLTLAPHNIEGWFQVRSLAAQSVFAVALPSGGDGIETVPELSDSAARRETRYQLDLLRVSLNALVDMHEVQLLQLDGDGPLRLRFTHEDGTWGGSCWICRLGDGA